MPRYGEWDSTKEGASWLLVLVAETLRELEGSESYAGLTSRFVEGLGLRVQAFHGKEGRDLLIPVADREQARRMFEALASYCTDPRLHPFSD